MTTMRVALTGSGRLARVSLRDVPLDGRGGRLLTSRALREKRWEQELRPDIGYSPTMKQRCAALLDAVQIEHAALHPSARKYVLPADAVEKVLG